MQLSGTFWDEGNASLNEQFAELYTLMVSSGTLFLSLSRSRTHSHRQIDRQTTDWGGQYRYAAWWEEACFKVTSH